MPDETPVTGTDTSPSTSPVLPSSQVTPDLPSGGDTPKAPVSEALAAFERYRTGAPAPTKTEAETPTESESSETPTESEVLEETPLETAAATVTGVSTRDYSNLEPGEIPIFKNMSKKTFEFLKPKYLEYKSLKKENETLKAAQESTSKSSFYDQPDAYQITPEYRNYASNIQSLDAELGYWKQQLSKIRAGEQWIPLVVGPNGQPVLGDPREASPDGEADVLDAMSNCRILKQDIANKASTIQSTFSTQHKSFLSQMESVRKDVFKGIDDKVLAKVRETKLSIFPAHMHSDPRIQIIAELLGVLDGFHMMLEESKAKTTVNGQRAVTAANAGPRAKNIAAGTAKPNTVDAAIQKFDVYKAQRSY